MAGVQESCIINPSGWDRLLSLIMLVEWQGTIDSFKLEGFFLEQFKQEGATLLMDILMHWAFCMHAHLRLAAAALVQLYD